MGKKNKKSSTLRHKIVTVVGIILSLLLLPILIVNITLLIRSYTKPNEVPSINGIVPMIVLTDSMYPIIESGDVVVNNTVDAKDIKKGDIITFFDPDGNGMNTVIHRVVKVIKQDGKLAFQTKGDALNAADKSLVSEDKVIGVFKFRLKGVGHVSMFMATPTGLIVCVVIPLFLLIGFDIIRRKRYDKKYNQEKAELLKELKLLKEEKVRKRDN